MTGTIVGIFFFAFFKNTWDFLIQPQFSLEVERFYTHTGQQGSIKMLWQHVGGTLKSFIFIFFYGVYKCTHMPPFLQGRHANSQSYNNI